jgi:transposase
MPAHHRFREDWTPQRIQARASRIGPNVAIFAEVVMRDRKHPEQGYRTCLGVIRLADKFGQDRLAAACRRALESEPLERHWSERQWRAPGPTHRSNPF